MAKNRPIGVFDSGIGGLTVAAGVAKAFPDESIVYFGDTAHLPYGDKSVNAIQEYAIEISRFLIAENCKLLVIACNSASAAAFGRLKELFEQEVVILDVISPLVEYVHQFNYNKVGVIATKATVSTNVYARMLQEKKPSLTVTSLATGLLVPMIEEGIFEDKISHIIIDKYLSYPDFEGIEALLLACTHYPLIRKEIEWYLKDRVKVFDSIEAVVQKIQGLFEERVILSAYKNTPLYQFWVSDYTKTFEQATQLFYGAKIQLLRAKWIEGKLKKVDA